MAQQPIRIDFVSDVACPWCVIGLRSLVLALHTLREEVITDLRFVPFELNPDLGPQGENLFEYTQSRYGATAEQSAALRKAVTDSGKALGFTFNYTPQTRVWNTFDAHRLMYWGAQEQRALELKEALFKMNFTDQKPVNDHKALIEAARAAGLDANRAKQVLSANTFAEEVRAEQEAWRNDGVVSVPMVVINRQWLLEGAQPAPVYRDAIKDVLSGKADEKLAAAQAAIPPN